MRSTLRHLFAILSLLSLLLCVVSVVTWILSYARSGVPIWPPNGWNVRSRDGQLDLFHQQPSIPGLLSPPGGLPPMMKPGTASAIHIESVNLLGQFGMTTDYRWQTNATLRASGIYVRYSLVVIVAALLAAVSALPAFLGHRRRARAAQGLCPTCGYDLRAHAVGDRCPECGMVPSPAR